MPTKTIATIAPVGSPPWAEGAGVGVGSCVWPGARTNASTTESATPLMVRVFAARRELCAAAAAPLPEKYTRTVTPMTASSRRWALVVTVINVVSTLKNWPTPVLICSVVKLLAESYVSCTTREYRKEAEVVRGNTAVVMGTGAGMVVETTATLLEVVIGLVVDGLMTTLELVVTRTVLDVSGVLGASVVAALEVVGLPFVELGAALVAALEVVALTLLVVVATLLEVPGVLGASVVAALELVGLPFVELGAALVAALEVVALTLLEVVATLLVEAVAALLLVLDVTAAAFVVVVWMAVELVVPLAVVAIAIGCEDPDQMYTSGVMD